MVLTIDPVGLLSRYQCLIYDLTTCFTYRNWFKESLHSEFGTEMIF